MRKQYYVRASDRGRLVWDVYRLVERSAALPRREVPLALPYDDAPGPGA